MKTRLHRIAVAVRDLDKAIATYEKLSGGKFHKTGEAVAKEAGVHVAAAWDVGIELVSPVKGCDNPITRNLEALLEARGDCVCGVGFCTDDLDATIRSAGELGIKPMLPTFEFTQEQIDQEFAGKYTRFAECPLDSATQLGFLWAANIIEEKPAQ